MASEDVINKIMSEYGELRMKAADDRRKRMDEVNKKYPRIAEIDREIFTRGLGNTNNILKNPAKKDEYNKDFKENLERLEREKAGILKENNVPSDYDKYRYVCNICSDTGYDENGKRCRCFKQRLINAAYSTSNMAEMIKEQNFETFSFDYYSKQASKEGVSPYENMVKIYNNCRSFCDNFDTERKGILFYGNPGLGKTFLSSAIAKEIMDRGKTVLYIRATRLMALYNDYRFNRNADITVIDDIYSCDLLIIDDLGTEPPGNNNISFLLDVINERADLGRKMIMNTNLTLGEIAKLYSRRFTSRLYENFSLYKFIGDDIRYQKFKAI